MDQEKLNQHEPDFAAGLPYLGDEDIWEKDLEKASQMDLDDLLDADLMALLEEKPEVTEELIPEPTAVMEPLIATEPEPEVEPEDETADETDDLPPAEAEKTAPREVSVKSRKKASNGTKIFYTVYTSLLIIAVAAILILMIPLHNWLVKYESSQPEQQCQAIFDIIFSDPDWAVIYDLAEVRDTAFEGKGAYIRYMEEKVSNAKNPNLTYSETSAGLSGDRKYIVKLDDEKIATFTLANSPEEDTGMIKWKLGVVEVFFERNESVLIEKLPEHTVYVNGVELDDNYTIRTVNTLAESYLPDGTHGYRMEQQLVTGLLVKPNSVTVYDASGNSVAMDYNEELGSYTLIRQEPAPMTEEEKTLALEAAKANALFAIRAISSGELRKHFDPNSQIYEDTINTPTFIQSFSKYAFDESVTSVTDFCRYSNSLFSAKVTLKLDVTRKNGTVKSLEMNTTYFFTLKGSGNYLVSNITNESVLERIEQVRLTFMQDDAKVATQFVATNADSLALPAATAPEGKVLKGWAQQVIDESGNITMTILFAPSESGIAQIPEDITLEPMTLYAVFENAEAAA